MKESLEERLERLETVVNELREVVMERLLPRQGRAPREGRQRANYADCERVRELLRTGLTVMEVSRLTGLPYTTVYRYSVARPWYVEKLRRRDQIGP
jgi:hypothetical protein